MTSDFADIAFPSRENNLTSLLITMASKVGPAGFGDAATVVHSIHRKNACPVPALHGRRNRAGAATKS